MAVTFNAEADLGFIYLSDGGVFGSNLYNSTAFDYFPNDAAVNDALYFGYGDESHTGCRGNWDDLKLYVGTAFAATSVTFVWEYLDKAGTWQTLTVTDGTNGFTTLGENWVTFDPSALTDWNNIGVVNNKRSSWIRVRITAVNTPTEGGAQSTQKVKVKDYAITVTGTGNTLATLQSANDSGGWSVMTQQQNQYFIKCHLHVGDGTTTTVLSDAGVDLQVGISTLWRYIWVRASATFQLGTQSVGITAAYGYRGNSLIWYDQRAYYRIYSSGAFKLYGVTFWKIQGTGHFNAGPTWNTVDYIGTSSGNILFEGGGTFTRVTFSNNDSSYGFMCYSAITITDMVVENQYKGIVCGFVGQQLAATNLILSSSIPEHIELSGGTYINLTDCTFTPNKIRAVDGWTGYVNDKRTFNLHVQDTNGTAIASATVKVVDSQGTTVIDTTTDASGNIAATVLTSYKYVRLDTGLGLTHLTTTNYNPFVCTISKSGYITKVIKYTMDAARTEVEVLEQQVSLIRPLDGGIYKNLRPTDSKNKTAYMRVS